MSRTSVTEGVLPGDSLATLAVAGASVDWIGTKGAAGCRNSSGTCGWETLLLASPILSSRTSLAGTCGHLRVGGGVGGAGSFRRNDPQAAFGIMETSLVCSAGCCRIGRSCGVGFFCRRDSLATLAVAGAGVDWIGTNGAAGCRNSSGTCDWEPLLLADAINPVPGEMQ